MSRGKSAVRWNQLLSFSPLTAKVQAAESVFWPGCAALKLETALMQMVYRSLRESVPGLGFSSWCCGKPTFSVLDQREKEKRTGQISKLLDENGIKKIYTLCPNCTQTLAQFPNKTVVSAWPLLADGAKAATSRTPAFRDTYILHDPCAARNDSATHEAVRRALAHKQVRWQEFEHRETKTRCCGRKDMLFLTDPARSKKMLEARIEASGGLPIITYCESCAEAFRSTGAPAYHLLEVLYDFVAKRSFQNRIQTIHFGEVTHA